MATTKKPLQYRTKWNLSILYKNDKDPQIEKDVQTIERACAAFEKKYRGKDFISTPEKLLKALEDSETLEKITAGSKPWWYFALKIELDSGDTNAAGRATALDQRITTAGNRVMFFGLEIAKIPRGEQKKFLRHQRLAPFRYELEKIFEQARYNLSEKEEQLESLLSQTSYSLWVQGQEKVLNKETVEYEGETMPLSKATSILHDLPKEKRRVLYAKIVERLKAISPFAESEINAVYNYKKTMDERRGYKQPYSASILGHENDEATVLGLVSLVTKYFSISRRFYKLHAKLLGEKKLTYADRAAKIGNIGKKFSFDETVQIVSQTFAAIDPMYKEMLEAFLAKGQIDVFPKTGKHAGAFCWGMELNPTFLLLNHTDDIRSVETLAHEMGHAIHTELSKSQPLRYQKYSTDTAEVASTFFEQAVSADLERHLSDSERLVFLHNKILGDISTIFRQIACFNFELELHKRIREKGQVSKEDIAALLAKHLRSYLGDTVAVTDDNGYEFVSWSHIRSFFYVYSYAYGQLVSRALFEKWKADPSYADKVKQFLLAGRSMSPRDIFKKIGIDTTDPAFFEEGLKGIEGDIARLEKLSKKNK